MPILDDLWRGVRQGLVGLERARDRRRVEAAADPLTGQGGGRSVTWLFIDGFLSNLIVLFRVALGILGSIYAVLFVLTWGLVVWFIWRVSAG
jgi:hypothetical protein